ncbi:WD40-repeat-containing domain protein [Protomyces lactucae-debilis]|uniref:WD40-repeat-containing domain protein n=1 Tax=Protomyces lactucae-debilis TaxID=2754530 RepID=A0A1Y2FAU3_PROLT|nr:WD40-repeat-containing domain protein [Protomyces lactucae-debilis]ORY81028.1 WD40-repeat-containing domain protein [Protomyces lactucae-debilis]
MKRATNEGPSQLIKRAKPSHTSLQKANKNGSITRTSDLKAPIMLLSGHEGFVYACKFSPDGQHLASGSFDRSILLWHSFGDCDNHSILSGSKNAVLDLAWSGDGRSIYSASSDHDVSTWDVHSGTRLKRHTGHTDVVNAIDAHRRGTELLCSGSDDTTIGLWDPRVKGAVDHYESGYSVTSVAFDSTGSQIFSGGIDEKIKVWDIRKRAVVYEMTGHGDTITSLALSPDGHSLLSNSMDSTMKTWNVQPFAPENRLVATFSGVAHGGEQNLIKACWNKDGSRVASGSADRTVLVWETRRNSLIYKLPGHKGTVNCVDFHPEQPILASGSTDKTLFLGELAI